MFSGERVLTGLVGVCVCRHVCLCLCFGVSSGEEVLTGLVGVCADIYVFVFWSVQWGRSFSWVG